MISRVRVPDVCVCPSCVPSRSLSANHAFPSVRQRTSAMEHSQCICPSLCPVVYRLVGKRRDQLHLSPRRARRARRMRFGELSSGMIGRFCGPPVFFVSFVLRKPRCVDFPREIPLAARLPFRKYISSAGRHLAKGFRCPARGRRGLPLRCEAHSLRRRRHVMRDLEKRSMRARQTAYSGARSTNPWTDVYGITSI